MKHRSLTLASDRPWKCMCSVRWSMSDIRRAAVWLLSSCYRSISECLTRKTPHFPHSLIESKDVRAMQCGTMVKATEKYGVTYEVKYEVSKLLKGGSRDRNSGSVKPLATRLASRDASSCYVFALSTRSPWSGKIRSPGFVQVSFLHLQLLISQSVRTCAQRDWSIASHRRIWNQ